MIDRHKYRFLLEDQRRLRVIRGIFSALRRIFSSFIEKRLPAAIHTPTYVSRKTRRVISARDRPRLVTSAALSEVPSIKGKPRNDHLELRRLVSIEE